MTERTREVIFRMALTAILLTCATLTEVYGHEPDPMVTELPATEVMQDAIPHDYRTYYVYTGQQYGFDIKTADDFVVPEGWIPCDTTLNILEADIIHFEYNQVVLHFEDVPFGRLYITFPSVGHYVAKWRCTRIDGTLSGWISSTDQPFGPLFWVFAWISPPGPAVIE